jgi:hypothetical protein
MTGIDLVEELRSPSHSGRIPSILSRTRRAWDGMGVVGILWEVKAENGFDAESYGIFLAQVKGLSPVRYSRAS